MKVETKETRNKIPIIGFSPGECFDYESKLYMVVDSSYYMSEEDNENYVFAVELTNGELVTFSNDYEVYDASDRVKMVVE